MNSQQFLPIDGLSADSQMVLPAADEEILHEDFGIKLVSALSALDREDEQILRLFYIHGFRYQEIIRAKGLSYSAATSRLHKAKNRLKALIGEQISPSEAVWAFTWLSGGIEEMRLGLSTDILNGIKAVEYAQCTEMEERAFLCSVNLEFTKKHGLWLVATDGRRMATAQLPDAEGDEDISLIIPTEELGILKESLKQKSGFVNVELIDEKLAAFYVDDVKKLVKLLPDKYPDYRSIAYPKYYKNSVTIERKPAIDIIRKIVEELNPPSPSDWIQWDDTIYILPESDILKTKEITSRATELCRRLIHYIIESKSPDDLSDEIHNYLSRDEYEKLLDEIEKRKSPPENPAGALKILGSEGDARFAGRFNSRFLLDALNAMTGDTVKIYYRLETHLNVTLDRIILSDNTKNVHVIMPMKVE